MRWSIATAALLAATTAQASEQYLTVAKEAARWIETQESRTASGSTWRVDSAVGDSLEGTLYYGSPGLVLFFLNLHRATGAAKYLDEARKGGDDLLARIETEEDAGLYTGLSGIAYALTELWKTTGDARYRNGAIRCVARVRQLAKPVGAGMEWSTFDIISGSAGIGLFLLYAWHELKDPQALALARCAADRLVEVRAAEPIGVSWADPALPVVMPNFSHGTAGAAHFLASIYLETHDRRYLDAALAGARHLLSIAATTGRHCLVHHHSPGGEHLYYLGWCHGPAGTARLFYRLYQATHDRTWLEWVDHSAEAVMESGIPEKQTPGFWNNVSVCCGSAGVARFFLDLYRARGDQRYLAFARRVATQLIATATRDEQGARWRQAEHRIKPDLLIAQPGYMQGAAGIASVLLDLDAVERGRQPRFTLPDSPF